MAEEEVDLVQYNDVVLEKMLKITVLGTGHNWDADSGYLLFQVQSDEELNRAIESIIKPLKEVEPSIMISQNRTNQIVNHIYNLIMQTYGDRIKYFMKGNADLGVFIYENNRWQSYAKKIDKVIESIDPQFSQFMTKAIVGEVVDKIRRNTMTDLPTNLSLLQFKNVIVDTKCFMDTGRILQCTKEPSPSTYAMYYIDRLLVLDKDIITALESKVLYGTEDVVPLAEQHTPNFVRLFKEWVGDQWVNLYEILGYTLLVYGNPLKLIFILIGPPNSGKSTYIRLLQHTIGEHNVVNYSIGQLSSESFERANLFLKMLNAYSDLPDRPVNVSELKELTGEDNVSAKMKYKQEPLTFKVSTKMLFATNELPKSWQNADEAFWSRVRMIQFPNQFTPKTTVEFPDDIETSKALLLALYFAKAMLMKGDITTSTESKLIVERAKRQNNSTEYFIAEAVMKDENAVIEFRLLYSAYEKWCEQWGITPQAQNIFSRKLNEMGYMTTETKVRTEKGYKTIRVVKGLKLRSEE